MKKTPLSLLLLLALNLPAKAQETPPPRDEANRPEAPSEQRGRETRAAEKKPLSYLGILTSPVSQELRTQLTLQEGFGLQVQEVMPDSPAKEAGLKAHDVLTKFEDQKLVNMEQLQVLVRSKKKDDQVLLTVISGGQPKDVTVKIGERMVEIDPERPRSFMPGFDGRRPMGDMKDWHEQSEDFQRRLREYQDRVQDWNRSGHRGQVPPPPMFTPPSRRDDDRREEPRGPRDDKTPDRRAPMPETPRGETHRFERQERHEAANITRSDETGIYSLRREDGRAVFTVKPKDGEEKTWPVNNDEERAAVPEPYRTKLKEMDEIRSNIRRDEEQPAREKSRDEPAPRPEGL
ncbi:MAG: hypothetical protein RL015_1446 [Verrucomicrobiota bacterium]|jgi:membrane-associated protease RseP (regulator of RpoE activity)